MGLPLLNGFYAKLHCIFDVYAMYSHGCITINNFKEKRAYITDFYIVILYTLI